MFTDRKQRGFKILRSEKSKGISRKLFILNDSQYVVMESKYLLGVIWKTRFYQFERQDQAEYFYSRLATFKLKRQVPGA